MNFHKTIGFLAALLLTLGLGVPDSFAQDPVEVNLSLSRSTYVRETSSVVVTVKLAEAPGDDTTVTIPVTVESSAEYVHTIDGVDDGATPPVLTNDPASVDVVISDLATTGTATVNIKDDDTFRDTGMLTVSFGTLPATHEAGDDDEVSLEIRDNEDPTGDLTITVSPPAVSAGSDAAQTLTFTVEISENVTVDLDLAYVVDGIDGASVASGTPIAANSKSVNTGTLEIPATTEAGTVTVTVSAVGYRKAMVTISIIDRDAEDVEGFRVTIAKPADGAWVGQGNKKVTVHVTRVNNTLSFPWESFSSLAVALRDTATTTGTRDIITVTASNFGNQDGNIVFSKAVTGPTNADGTASAGAANINAADAANLVTYVQADDRLIFAIQLPKVTAANVVATLGTLAGEAGTTGEVDDTPADNHPQVGSTLKGQRMGVYAVATFTPPGGAGGMIRSNDTKKKVFSNPASPGADQTVGDGKHLKIDLLVPDNIAANADLNVTLNNDTMKLTQNSEAKIGDEIKVAVGIGARTRFIRDGGMQIQIQTVKNSDPTGNANTATLKTANFNQAQISAASGDSLRTSVRLTSGLIKTKATVDGKTRDDTEIKKNALFQPDYVELRARVRTKDQAGNFSGARQIDFYGDTRMPGISVLHPADGGRFTGAHADTEFDEHLNPLKVRVDEEIDSLYVHVDGLKSSDGDDWRVVLWADEERDQDRGDILARAKGESVGDTIVYDTKGLMWKNAKNELKATGQGGTKVDLAVVAVDKVGNTSKKVLKGVFHDEKVPTIDQWFPRRSLLEGDNYQINDATRHPVITLKEAVDSLSVTYDPVVGANIVEVEGNLAKGEHQVIITKPFVHDRTYSLTIFARDLAGNAYMTVADSSADLRFNQQFDNPKANAFKVENMSAGKSDSVVAGQAFKLRLKAIDKDASANTSRPALTYKNVDADGNMASKVLISAWDMGSDGMGMAGSVMFEGGGVTDNGDGSAMLDAGGWKLGERTVFAKSEMAIDHLKVMVEHRNAGEGGTSVAAFNGAIDSLTVDAADFATFELTAWEDGVEGEAQEVWGDFMLRVVPTDKFGNPSVKAYKTENLAKGNNEDEDAAADSLNVLDTRLTDNGYNYKDGIDVTLRSLPDIGLPPFEWRIEPMGQSFPVTAPSNRKSVAVQVRVDNTSLMTDDKRSMNVKASKSFKVSAPITPMLTLWVPGSDMDEAGNDVVVPADGITVTVAAEGYNPGDMVTFTKNGTAMDPVAADDEGVARLMIMMSAAGTVTVSASNGVYLTGDLEITFVDAPAEPARKSYVDANGMPVYLIYAGDAPPDMVVGVDDFLALVAAFGSSMGDDSYNAQADVDDSGTVEVADFLEFVTSFGRTAVGPATKPLVLLPGINENAEFSLSLGSERVVAGELVAVDVSLTNVAALIGYGFALNYENDKFEFVSVAPADEDLLKSTGGETLFHHIVADGQVTVANGLYNGTAVSGGGDVVQFVFRVLREFEDNARFEIADGLVFDPSQLQNPAVVAGVLELQSTPREFALHQNFPNPFNPDTTIKYDLAESADVTLQIYNVLGQVIRTLVASEAQNAGRYQIRWNGMDDRGVPVSSGIYFYQISADGKFSDVRKLMLLK